MFINNFLNLWKKKPLSNEAVWLQPQETNTGNKICRTFFISCNFTLHEFSVAIENSIQRFSAQKIVGR